MKYIFGLCIISIIILAFSFIVKESKESNYNKPDWGISKDSPLRR